MQRISVSPLLRYILLYGFCIFLGLLLAYQVGLFFLGKQHIGSSTFLWNLFVFIIALVATRSYESRRADEVLDYGDHLVVRSGVIQQEVSFNDIETVKFRYSNPPFLPYIEMKLSKEGPLGKNISFFVSFVGWGSDHPTALSLRKRLERPKSG